MAGTLFDTQPAETADPSASADRAAAEPGPEASASVRRARAGREQFRGDGRVEVALASLEELLARDVVSLEGELSAVRAARSRLDGYETFVLEAIETVKGSARREPPPVPGPEPDASAEPGSDHECGSPEPGPAPGPVPGPRLSKRERMRRERRARRLQLFPKVRAALEAGRISAEQADLLTEAGLDRDIVNALLTLAVRHGDADQTRADVQAARAQADEEDPDKALRRLIAARRGGWGFDPDGSFWINARLDPLTAALLAAELDRLERHEFQAHDKPAGIGARTPGQRRADVLTLLLGGVPPGREASPTPDTNGATGSTASGTKTVLHLILRDRDATRPDGVAHTMNGTPIPVGAVAGLFDDAELHAWRINCTGDLIGHSTGRRHATKTQRLALAIRHGTCVWHGCNRAASGCDAHHMTEWHLTRDGRLVNLTLLCPEHHHQLHQMGGVLTPDPARTHGWQITHLTAGSVERVVSRWQKPPPTWLQTDTPPNRPPHRQPDTPSGRPPHRRSDRQPPPGDPELN